MSSCIKRFKKILVAVDLSDDDRFVSDALPVTTQCAIRQAEWLAKENSAELTLFYVLPPRAIQLSYDRQILMGGDDDYKSVQEHAGEVLSELAEALTKRGIKAKGEVVFGTSWIEVIQKVLRDQHDLVIAGTRKKGPFRSMLFGSTGIKLLRKCPCPVWIIKPPTEGAQPHESLLVAHDLTPVGDAALELGSSFAQRHGMTLHVLHAIENRDLAHQKSEYLARDEASRVIHQQLKKLKIDDSSVHLHITAGQAEEELLKYIEQQNIQLVVMGTIARTGISGVVTGNTAEKLLPLLSCSVLALKPAGFNCPLSPV